MTQILQTLESYWEISISKKAMQRKNYIGKNRPFFSVEHIIC